jgi:hypothetical protein
MYMPSTGRFDRLDPFAGNPDDPQSFHKYGYAHANPIMNVDPNGEFSVSVSIGIGLGIMGAIGVGVGYYSKNDGGFWQSIIPGFGSGRGLGKAIADGDPLGIGVNGAFLALDILTAGGWSFVVKGVGKPVLKGISKEALESLYQSVVKVAKDPEFIVRAAKAGFDPHIIDNLLPAIDDYVKRASFGIREGVSNWVDDATFALTEKGAKSWNTIAHELTHILDGIANPGLLKQGGATAFQTLKAEYKAFYVSMGSPFMAGVRSFAQYAIVTAADGRPFMQATRQFMNAYLRWYDGDEDLLQ